MSSTFEHPVSIAPMMQRTDRHFRYMMRRISRRTLLYTEMVTANALEHGDRERLLTFHDSEHPIALQVGGDDPELLSSAARLAEEWGYDEINLNVGCPSPRVQKGNFGACLMQTPEVVAEAVRAMRAATGIEVTVKHRIGVDDQEDWDDLRKFVATVADAGCTRFTVHARKAWLQGLSPKENRNVPPLKYDLVYRLKEAFPELVIEINGHVKSVPEISEHLGEVDAVMIGRAAYDDPWLFAAVDEAFYGDEPVVTSRFEVVDAMVDYARGWVADGGPLHHVTRHMLNLFAGVPGARQWRRGMSEAGQSGDPAAILETADAVREVQESVRSRLDASAANGQPPVSCGMRSVSSS